MYVSGIYCYVCYNGDVFVCLMHLLLCYACYYIRVLMSQASMAIYVTPVHFLMSQASIDINVTPYVSVCLRYQLEQARGAYGWILPSMPVSG